MATKWHVEHVLEAGCAFRRRVVRLDVAEVFHRRVEEKLSSGEFWRLLRGSPDIRRNRAQ